MRTTGFSSLFKRLFHVLHGRTLVPFTLLFVPAMLFVFSEVLSKWLVTTSPDDSPFYASNYFVSEVDSWLSDKVVFMWQRCFRVLDPVSCHELTYVICLFFLGLSGVYYLRTQKASRLSAWGGGLFLSLSGYLSTLFCAGHLGFFYMLASVFWSLGLINRCLDDRGARYFAMLGCVLMWGQPGQPDIWVLAVALLAAYTLWRMSLMLRAGAAVKALVWRICPRFLLTVVVAALTGVWGIQQVFQQHLAARDQQIEESSRAGGQPAAVEQESQQKAFDRWVFATGWSLPPEDCAEFLVPGIFGNDSFQPPYPYWGRLGQPYAFQPGKMMPNYRSHTVYLGLISIIVAFFGVFAWLSFRRAKDVSPLQPPSACRMPTADCRLPVATPTSDLRLPTSVFTDVPFWCAVWLVCLILAMGRYTPIYKLFYSIPYMDYLRAPVKFLHFTEVATALLAGFGLEALLAGQTSSRLRRGFVFGVVAAAGLLGVAALLVILNGAAIEQHISTLGLGQFSAALRGYAAFNCLRAMALALGVAGLFWLSAARVARGRSVTAVIVCLIVLGVADQASVARRHVVPLDVRPFHEANVVIREMQKRTEGRPANVANYATRNVFGQDWFNTALSANGFPNRVPDPANPSAVERPFAEAMQSDPLRFWQVMGIRFVVLAREQAEPLVSQRLLTPVCEFEMGQGTVRRTSGGAKSLVLGELREGGLPKVYFAWTGGVAKEEQVAAAIKKEARLPVCDAPPPPAPSGRLPQPAALTQIRGGRGIFVTKGDLDLPEPGLLVWNERYAPDLVARVDGKDANLRQVDGLWCAVEIPAGKHSLTCRMRYRPLWNSVLIGVSLAVCLAMVWRPSRQ